MASAIILPEMGAQTTSDITNPQLSQAITKSAPDWAEMIRKQLGVVSTFENPDESVPDSVLVDESIMDAPRRRATNAAAASLAMQIAQLLYPSPDDSLGSIIKYEKDIVKLRKFVIHQRKRVIERATQRNELRTWDKRILKQGAWDPVADPVSLGGAPSLPMPVQIAEPESLAPFFEHLRLGGTQDAASTTRAADAKESDEPYYSTKTLEFEKGVLYTDRRMDLCKMVLGPTNIGDLIESLKTNTFVTHFLLGNNIIGPHGAKCIANFLEEFPDRMDTWYLAGNCIDGLSFKVIVDKWVKSISVTNIWLKRNPLMSASAGDVYRLITQTKNLRTLDLDQTELGDEGVAELFTRLAKHDSNVPLKHIYLNAIGIGEKGATAIAQYLASPHCGLDSLYASNNPVGSGGANALAVGLKKNKSLSRLTLASAGLSDDGVIALCDALQNHPNFNTLDIGQGYATEDLGSRYNWITDASAAAISNLIVKSPQLAFLNLGSSALTHHGLNEILRTVQGSTTLLYYKAKTIHPQGKDAISVHAGQSHLKLAKTAHDQLIANVKRKYGDDMAYDRFMEEEKRWLVNDKTDVRKIDSVYRNRDAGMAIRGLKKLEKWWDEDDTTLQEVMKGAVGPVCTKRKVKVDGPV